MSQDVTGVLGAQSADNNAPRIIDFRHPAYSRMSLFWMKWRFVYAGGDDFSEQFLEKYSDRESTVDFNLRRRVTPSPSFAKAAVNDIKNSIFQRMIDITRIGGPKDYTAAVKGLDNGVDMHGATMNSFIGRYVLPELLTMAKVGIFVDMPDNVGDTLMESAGKRPYLYMYRAEQILSWTYRDDKADEFASVLLVDYVDDLETASNLPIGTWSRFRHMWIDETDGKVHVQYYNEDNGYIDRDGVPNEGEYVLNINFIPLVVMELTDSLLSDVANHQIALLNLESSDVLYALKSNFPFYVEQNDSRLISDHLKGASAPDGSGAGSPTANDPEIEVGSMQGRRYGKGMERPGFIHPSAEPLNASMAKQKQLKDDIRQLVNLALSNIKPKMASAESKSIDERGLESGLAYVGLELEHGERKLARYWAAYQGDIENGAEIMYPAKYQIQSDDERRAAVKNLEEVRDKVFSPTFRKAVTKQIARLLLDGYADTETLAKIDSEIDQSVTIVADPTITLQAVEKGVCDLDLAGKILGYPEGTAQKAAEDHSERLIRIMKAQGIAEVQTGRQNTVINDPNNPGADARGASDLAGQPGAGGKQEKAAAADQTTNPNPTDPTRGPGKGK